MNDPSLADRPKGQADDVHLAFARRGTALLPEAVEAEGRINLGELMLGLAVLAPGFALGRTSLLLGFAWIVVGLAALTRSHDVMNRLRENGESPGLVTWPIAVASSAVRVVLGIGSCSLALAIGCVGGYQVAFWLVRFARIPDVIGFPIVLLVSLAAGIATTTPVLTRLAPRLLAIAKPRDISNKLK